MATTPYSTTARRRLGPALATAIVVAVCLLIIAASTLDLHCTALRPANNTIVLACSAGRVRP